MNFKNIVWIIKAILLLLLLLLISPSANFSLEETAIIDKEIEKVLAKGIIETAAHDPDEILSNIFVRPKKDGGYRLILNLKGINQFATYHHFKMDTIHSMLKLVEKMHFTP